VEAIAMGSLLEELARREAAARKRIEEIREQIERLQEDLTAEEQALSRLVVTRETVREILGEAASEQPPSDVEAGIAGGVDGPEGASAAEAVTSGGSPIGVVTVPAWRPGTDASVLPQAYRDVLEVLVDAGRPLRAKQLVVLLGLPAEAAKVEGLRSKLKRLVTRGWLTEDSPGMFAVTRQITGQAAGPQESGPLR
jgi:hypothetical protein